MKTEVLEKGEDDFHVDMSGRFYEERTIGIAIVGTRTNLHYGCALKGNLIKLIKIKLFKKNSYGEFSKVYAICIYLLIQKIKDKIKTLIICNDEDFNIVKKGLSSLLVNFDFEIINIREFRKRLGRNIGSLADNYARIYRKKALKPNRLGKGKELNIVNITFKIIKQSWEVLEKINVSE